VVVVAVVVTLAVAACSTDTSPDVVQGDDRPSTTVSTVDDYGDDPSVDSGTREEVCRGGAAATRTGRARLAAFIAAEWPDVLDVLGFECREVDYPSSPDCDGEVDPPQSTCWSTHASGRAIDIVVSTPGTSTPEGVALGDVIVTAFLASVDGVAHRMARVTGVQEIIWHGRCWHPDSRDVVDASHMAPCSISGHDDHVHLTLSDAGADGQTSWYTVDANGTTGATGS
jgi:hypothetical protein